MPEHNFELPHAHEASGSPEDDGKVKGDPDALIHSEILWLDDGNVVLQAEKTQFRVHKSILSNHSKFFKDLFSVPQPEGEPLVEGCPVVKLPDTTIDWENLLEIVYDGLRFFHSTMEVPVSTLVSMLRLGQKYQFDHCRDIAAERFRAELPCSIKGWDTSDLYDHENYTADNKEHYFTKGSEFDLLNVALEVGLDTVLPVAYYLCLRDQSLNAIFKGTVRLDGTLALLSGDSQRILVLGREKIFHAIRKYPLSWLTTSGCVPQAQCRTPTECCEERRKQLEDLAPSLHTDISLAFREPVVISNLCQVCTAAIHHAIEEGREKLWDKLPSYFELPTWESLTDFDI